MMSPAKKAICDLSEQLAENCSWDEAMYGLYVRQKIQQGFSDLEQGSVDSHEDVFREYADAEALAPVDADGSK